ncbi:MAG: site-2 protease family protein [Methanosarcinales archaeon]|nr:site-2 protease family protein [Methanosarcinales archaeon]
MPEIEQSQVAGLEQVHFQTVRSKKMAIFNTSSTELKHLFIAWMAISFAFAFVLAWHELGNIRPTSSQIFGPFFADLFIISLITVGVSFIFHEMGHKFVAQKYGAWAEFRMSFGMLLLAIYMAWQIGILFAAPGAVQIFGPHITKKQYGKIAASGPMMNLFLAFAFMPLLNGTGFLYDIGRLGVIINLLLAGFNMLPISVLDGRKVLAWSPIVYIGLFMTVIVVGLFFYPKLL